ncbi:MAG: DUF402 domain-containing protein [Anaerolineae bacterium]
MMPDEITVLKRDVSGVVTWQYRGRLLRREVDRLVLEAYFNRPDLPFLDVVLKEGDRFVETFFTNRWYNVFEIYDRDDGQIKGWYCNIARPAEMGDGFVSYVDLALDLWVAADGHQVVMDEDEFLALRLDDETRQKAREALAELQRRFRQGGAVAALA